MSVSIAEVAIHRPGNAHASGASPSSPDLPARTVSPRWVRNGSLGTTLGRYRSQPAPRCAGTASQPARRCAGTADQPARRCAGTTGEARRYAAPVVRIPAPRCADMAWDRWWT